MDKALVGEERSRLDGLDIELAKLLEQLILGDRVHLGTANQPRRSEGDPPTPTVVVSTMSEAMMTVSTGSPRGRSVARFTASDHSP